jgi:hypothetical protein
MMRWVIQVDFVKIFHSSSITFGSELAPVNTHFWLYRSINEQNLTTGLQDGVGTKNDRPYIDSQVRNGVISCRVSSYGYDIVFWMVKVFTNVFRPSLTKF